MEYEYKTVADDELVHWGVLGMKWGVRRYQNKDGTLTPRGKKRYKEELDKVKEEERVVKNRKSTQAKFERLAARKKAVEDQKKELDGDKAKKKKTKDEDAKQAKKSAKDMSDDELAYAIRRVQMEKQYEALTAEPETAQKGTGFVKDFMSKSVAPSVQEAGKTLIKDSLLKAGKKYLGLDTKAGDEYLTELRKEVQKMTLEKQYKNLKDEAEGTKTSDNDQPNKPTSAGSDTSRKTSGFGDFIKKTVSKTMNNRTDNGTENNSQSTGSKDTFGSTVRSKASEAASEAASKLAAKAVSNAAAKFVSSVTNIPVETTNAGKNVVNTLLLEGPVLTKKTGNSGYATYDEKGKFIGYWSGIRGDSDGII